MTTSVNVLACLLGQCFPNMSFGPGVSLDAVPTEFLLCPILYFILTASVV
jgi:hypothetical protein